MNKVEELRKLSQSELQEKLGELQRELFETKMIAASSQGLKNNQLVSTLKRRIAQVKTLITELMSKQVQHVHTKD